LVSKLGIAPSIHQKQSYWTNQQANASDHAQTTGTLV
jgi:hypothetical protein